MGDRDIVVELLKKSISPPFKALVGDGAGTIVVSGRAGWIWVRKLGKTELLFQAYNRGAPAIEDVIVLVQESRIEGVKGYEVIGVASATSPGNIYPEVPPHAWTHEWRPGIGRDRVTIYPRAWGYLRAEPIQTGSTVLWVTPGWYYYNGEYHWYPGGYSPGFTAPPAGTWYETLYMDPSDETLHLITGSTAPYGYATFVAPPDCMYPIAAVEITTTGSFTINENMIEDIRLFMDPIAECGGIIVHDHENDAGGGQLDHGLAHLAASLLHDDHTQYLKERASGGLGTEVPVHTHVAGQGGQLDWDDVWGDDIHDHSGPGEGGQVDLTDIIDSAGQLLTGPQRTDLTDGGTTTLHQHAGAVTNAVEITLTNRTGGQLISGDVVVTDPNNDESVVSTAIQGYQGKVLVASETIANLATGTFWERGGPFDVWVIGVVNRNDALRTSTTPLRACATSPTGTGIFAFALSQNPGGVGQVKALFFDEIDGSAGGDGAAADFTIWEPDAAPPSPSAYDDEFEDAAFDAVLWTEFDPNALLTISEDEAGLHLLETAQAGNDVCGIYQSIPAGNFSLSTKVSLIFPYADYNGTGLVLWDDATNVNAGIYMFQLCYYGANMYIRIARYTNHQTWNSSLDDTIDMFVATGIYQRIRRSGSTYYFEISTDGLGWLELWSGSLAFTPSHFGVGTDVVHGTEDLKARFAFFRYEASDVGDSGLLKGDRIDGWRS